MLLNIIIVLSFIIGASIGSFLNVVILRLPEENVSIVFPASRCPKCLQTLKWFDNIPIISFILLQRKCRSCGAPISWQYPMVELAMGLLSVALLFKFGLTITLPIYLVFTAALLVIIVIDFYHKIIPDVISLPGIVIGFVCSFFNPVITWQQSGIGLLIGGGVLYAVAAGYYLFTKREGMGGGDIKLLAMIGAFLGWQSLPFVVFGSSILGAAVGIGAMAKQKKGGKTMIPYGPFLSIAALLYMFYRELIDYYLVLYFLGPPQ
ncbi:MAG: prepilin peptidase [Deltaproteobacteria bacterium]|jgi:leader peptidase (prepilin peptidase)/N-methyltransferase|nr:prepilin peptidase [Deltaproteobacteria bacterium]